MVDSTAPESFVVDINMLLPASLQNEAALAAIRERASNAPDPNAKGKFALAVAKNRLWRIGRHLRVHFLDASDYPPGRAEMVMEAANEWTQHANLVFEVSNDPNAELRVSFNPNSGCSSYIGTDALLIAPPAPTIKLSVMGEQELRQDYRKYVLHEFGHAIGCIHEHSTPIAGIQWNRPVVYPYYHDKYGWEKPMVDYNVFSIFEEASSNHVYPRDQKIDPNVPIVTEHSPTFDPDSIMVYPIPKEHTSNGYEVKWGVDLSPLDKSFIASMYPKEQSNIANGTGEKLIELRRQAYDQRQQVTALAHLVYDLGQSEKLPELIAAQNVLQNADKEAAQAEIEAKEAAAAAAAAAAAIKIDAPKAEVDRSLKTTGVKVQVLPRMEFVPTAYYHLLDPTRDPLVECVIESVPRMIKRLRITAYIDGYTARAVQTVEIEQETYTPRSIFLLPTLFPERVRDIRELTRATLNVLAEDLDKNNQIELHETRPIWLLSRNSATFEIDDPTNPDPSKRVKDFRHYLGAFVTPNHPRVQHFLRQAAGKHFEKALAGDLANATEQASAIYSALKENAEIIYVNASLAFNPRVGAIGQRVRLPHECLEEKQANCLDGALLFASLLEALGLDAAIVLTSGHAMVGWRVGKDPDRWNYVDTTLIHSHDFWPAKDLAGDNAMTFQKEQAKDGVEPGTRFRQLVLNDLRSQYGVTPLA